MTLEESAQREIKRARIVETLGLPVDAYHAAPAQLGYRWSAKRVVGGRRGSLVFGSYLRGSHRVADMAGCQVDHPRIVEALDQLLARANSMQITAWRAPGDGELRYVWAKCNGEAVLLTLLGSAEGLPRLRTLAQSLKSVDGVYVAAREATDNALRGHAEDPPLEHVTGLEQLPYPDAGVEEGLGPLGFLQPNPEVAARAYDALIAGPEGESIRGEFALDLYAGAGVTTTRLRRHFVEVRPVESYPESARALDVPPERAADFLAHYSGPTPELVVANPPRAGLGGDCCTALAQLGAPRLHIMSCSPDSFRRDLDALSEVYQLQRLELFDTLPQTAHVELVAWLRKRDE
jgi:23S rRNA (uracil1939-C5)-methyltransferase